jgi:WD40 repeat protein
MELKLIASFDHRDRVKNAVFSPDGTRILTASWDKTAKLWDAASAGLIASFAHQDRVNNAVFSSDGTRILTAGIRFKRCQRDMKQTDDQGAFRNRLHLLKLSGHAIPYEMGT